MGCNGGMSSGFVNYEDQRATMMDILFENSKKEYLKSVTERLQLKQKRFVQGKDS
jgi:hypothetical protein